MAWTQQGTGITWGSVEDPIHWTDGSGAKLDYNPDDASNWWRNWQTQPTPDYSGLGQNYDPLQSGGGSVAPTMVGGGINAAPEGKTYWDVLKDVLTNTQGPQGANPAATITQMSRTGYLQSLPGFDQNHWATVVEPYVAEIMGDFNSNRTANMGVLSVVAPAVGGMAASAYGAGAGAAGAAGAEGASAAAGGTAAGSAGYSMPAAQALSGAELSGMGLSQMGSGVWAGSGATGYLGAPMSAGLGGAQLGGQNYSTLAQQAPETSLGAESGLDPNFAQHTNFGAPQDLNTMASAAPGGGAAPVANVGGGQQVMPSGGGGDMTGMPQGGGVDMTRGSGFGWNPSTVQTGVGIGSGLYGLYNANQANQNTRDALNQMNQNTAPQYPNQLNWDLVDQYLRDPMSVLRNNPGYLASVDFVEREGKRMAAKGGYNVSGNKGHYLADTLGRNAESWYNRAWAPIRDAAGLGRPDLSVQLGQAGMNAQNTINQTRNRAVSDMFNAGTKAIPDLFRMFSNTGTA
jgi:hypothetical protein